MVLIDEDGNEIQHFLQSTGALDPNIKLAIQEGKQTQLLLKTVTFINQMQIVDFECRE